MPKTQSMSLLGVKRTWIDALQMSAPDPKRTLVLWQTGKDATYSTARVCNITDIPRDKVYVDVHAWLTSRLADIDTNVVAIGWVFSRNVRLRPVQQSNNWHFFSPRHFEEVSNVPPGDNQDVTLAETVVVVTDKSIFVTEQRHIGTA
jgi:hypothetical protein